MKIAIDNLDYSAALDAVTPLSVVRRLNEPSTCRLYVTLPLGAGLPGSGLATPLRNAGLQVVGDDGTVYFTGYLAVSPLAEYAGEGLAGPRYRWLLEAVSDEVLLDTQLLPPSAGSTGVSAGRLMQGLVARTGSGLLATAGLTLSTVVSHFVPEAGAKFSRLAGQAATQVRAAYRAVSGALQLTPVGTTVHTLSEGNGLLSLGNLTLTPAVERALANDVTVCGAEEPVAYVTEYFEGDGVAVSFPLSEEPYVGPVAQERVIRELFQEGVIDLRRWSFTGNDIYFSITGAGLTFNGGNGTDGQAALVWADPVEAGGTLLLEAVGVNLALGSTGIVAGLYSGIAQAGSCVAGFAVTAATGTGVVSVAPLVQGAVAGAAFVLNATHSYTLRVRVHCAEVERILQAYRTTGDAGAVLYGGGGVVATGQVVMEVQEFVNGVGGTPVVLYDGAVGYLPGSYLVAAASSVNLIGTMRSLYLKGQGTGWVTSTVPGGAPRTRRLGSLADAGECRLSRSGTGTGALEFYTGLGPVLGEIVAVQYRSSGRAVGRAVNAASQAALAAAGSPATAVWTGSATEPLARSSRDCRNAALALVTAASSVSAAWSGTYRSTNVGLGLAAGVDVWPGDALLLTAPSLPVAGQDSGGGGLNAQVVVRQVELQYAASRPDLVGYAIAFSNDWANDLSVKTSRAVPEDAWLPAAVSPTYLASLTGLVVTGISAGAVSVAANVTPPAGGGFEVRRRDFAFGLNGSSGSDVDLVLRSAVGNFDIPRATEADRFFVRMYDASVPPNYSEFSVGLFLNLPLS